MSPGNNKKKGPAASKIRQGGKDGFNPHEEKKKVFQEPNEEKTISNTKEKRDNRKATGNKKSQLGCLFRQNVPFD